MKKILSSLLVVLLLTCMCSISYASDNADALSADIGLKYTYISNATTSISISSSGKATLTNSLSCSSSVDKVTVSTYLQRYSNSTWSTVQHWTDTESDNSYVGAHSYYVVSGYNYRVLTYFYAYDGTVSESTYLTDYEAY